MKFPPAHSPENFLDDEKARACIHCGLCLGACPTYLETGNENDSPRGRIYLMRAFQEAQLGIETGAVRHIDLCLGCRACETACPSGVAYGALLEETRDHIEKNFRRGWLDLWLRKGMIEQLFPFPRRMKLALGFASLARWLRLPALLPARAREMLSLLPEQCQSMAIPEFTPAQNGEQRGRAGLVTGCVMSVMFGQTHAATLKLLARAGWNVVAPPNQACCGALYAHSGNLAKARQTARLNIGTFEAAGVDIIVINAAGCGSTLKEYGQLLEGDSAWAERACRFSAKVLDLSEVLSPEMFDHAPPCREKVTFHDACHLAHAQRISTPPRELVKRVARDLFVELFEADLCCGSAGSYNLTEPEMAGRLQQRKVDNVQRAGADIVVTTNPGCILQIQAGLKKRGMDKVKVLHLAEFLAGALPDAE
jgi:glycolate oxidase iron-sulfur subunit